MKTVLHSNRFQTLTRNALAHLEPSSLLSHNFHTPCKTTSFQQMPLRNAQLNLQLIFRNVTHAVALAGEIFGSTTCIIYNKKHVNRFHFRIL